MFKVLKANDEDIETTQEEVSKTLEKKDYQAYLPVTLSRQVSRESAMEIMGKQLPGIQVAVNYIREYPYGSLASHVLGYLGQISEKEMKSLSLIHI